MICNVLRQLEQYANTLQRVIDDIKDTFAEFRPFQDRVKDDNLCAEVSTCSVGTACSYSSINRFRTCSSGLRCWVFRYFSLPHV